MFSVAMRFVKCWLQDAVSRVPASIEQTAVQNLLLQQVRFDENHFKGPRLRILMLPVLANM